MKSITRSILSVIFIFIVFGIGQTATAATIGEVWTSRASAADNSWQSITYGNGLFVAVSESGQGNRVMTSPDGITWTSRTAAANNTWTSVTYGNGMFVAVASSGGIRNRVMTSPDGITWTIRHSATRDIPRTTTLPDGSIVHSTTTYDSNWSAATYNNGLFVAVGYDGDNFKGTVMTSPDGITWTSRASAADNTWTSVTYGNGLFVAVSESGQANRVMTSPDGITWTARTAAANSSWESVTYGNGIFVAVADNVDSNRVMTSPDGITWTLRADVGNESWSSVTYGNGLFVAISSLFSAGRVTGRVMTSPDGITWTPRTATADNNWTSVTYGNGLFVAVAQSGFGNRIMTSPDGITWTSRTAAANNQWTSVTYGNGLFVAVSSDYSSPFCGDGSVQGGEACDDGNKNNGDLCSSSCQIGPGTLGDRVMTSPDGITWTSQNVTDNLWKAVTYGNGLFVAVSYAGLGNRVMTSPACISTYPNLTSTFTLDPSISFTKNEPIDLSAVTSNDSTIDITTTFTDELSYSWDNGTTWESLATFNHDVIPVAPPTFGPLPPPVSLLADDSVTNTASYTPNQSGTLLLQHCVDVDDVIEEDVGEIPNCIQVSVPVRGAEIQESGGCIISDGAGDNCYGFLIWKVTNPIGEVSVYNVQIEDEVASGATGINVPILLRKGINEIRIQDGSDVLATVVLGAECSPTSVWDAMMNPPQCVPRPPAPVITVDASAILVRSGKQVPVTVEVAANYDLACTVYGIDGGPSYITHEDLSGIFPPTSASYMTRPLYSTQIIDVICIDSLGIVTHDKTKVRVMPKIWEN